MGGNCNTKKYLQRGLKEQSGLEDKKKKVLVHSVYSITT